MKLFPPFQFRISQKFEFQVCLEILYEEPMGEHSLSKLTNFDFYMKVDTNKEKYKNTRRNRYKRVKPAHVGSSGTILVLHAIYLFLKNVLASSYHIMAL